MRRSIPATTAIPATAIVLAALLLSACATAAPDSGTASDPPASSEAAAPAETEAEEPAETEPAPESEEPAAEADPERDTCELIVRERFAEDSPRLATADDYAASAATIGFDLPAEPTCGVVYPVDSGAEYTLHVFVDQPTVAAALVDGFTAQGWTASQENGAGYIADAFRDGELYAGVSPIGVDNPISAWGQIWPGKDVTLFGLEQP